MPELDGKYICQDCGQGKEYHNNYYSDPIPVICPACKEKPSEFKCEFCAESFMSQKKGIEFIDGKIACDTCRVRIAEEETTRRKNDAIRERLESIIPAHFRKIETERTDKLESSLGKSLYITGPAGTGKSVFMYSLAKRYILAGESVRIIRFTKWVMEMQSLFRSDNSNPFQSAENIASFRGILFIDDLGAEKATEYIRQLIYFILDEREQNDLVTVITSNLGLKEIDASIDQRASSRIVGMCEVLKFSGEDQRLKRAKK